LTRYAGRLGIDPTQFRFESVRHSLVGTHIRGRQFVDGVPVDASSAIVSLTNGKVVWVEAHSVSATGGAAPLPIGATTARSAALAALGVTDPERVSSERLLVVNSGMLTDVYRLTVFSLAPAVAATVDVSTESGRVIKIADRSLYADAVATLFDPNPIVSTKNNALRTPGVDEGGADTDLDSPELTAALRDLPIKEYDPQLAAAGRLVGPWVTSIGPAPHVGIAAGRLDYTRGDPRFESAMAYAHLDRYQRYLQDVLGFTGAASVNAESQDVYALPVQGYDNSFYQPGNDLMLLGAGGVDDGEDAEVILHEYGHAVQDAQVPAWGANAEGGAMGEGFGDFQAGTYYARTSGGFQDVCLMDWDSTSYSSSNPPCIRRMDSPKVWPADKENEVHADGEIWSTFLWRIRNQLFDPETADQKSADELAIEMSDNALKLVISSHEFLTKQAKFVDAVAALDTAANALGHPEWLPIIDSSARVAGFRS
jgi:hypothetical protein